MVTMFAANGTLGGSALASWRPFWILVGIFAAIVVALYVVGRPSERRWPLLQPLSRIPNGLERITGIPGWAAVSIGTALYGLLVAGQGFYSDVAWHIALGRDKSLFTAPHSGILLGLVMILGAAVLGLIADHFGIVFVYQVCAFLPLLGLLAVFLPDVRPPEHAPVASRA